MNVIRGMENMVDVVKMMNEKKIMEDLDENEKKDFKEMNKRSV
jgi:hypothetical protein